MKNFFQYQALIKSSDLALAISSPIGVGPFCGFGSGTINSTSTSITLTPNPASGLSYTKEAIDLIARRYLSKINTDSEEPDVNFGCIARDGTIFTSPDSSIVISNIQGTKGSYNEVFVFAVHTQVEEPVENPVDFVAYWNESSTDFYTMYKKALDPYYPTSLNLRTLDINANDVYESNSFNYNYLENQVKSACSAYNSSRTSWALIGVYGTGTNAMTRTSESFAIVPYFGKYPVELPYNTANHSMIKQSISHIESMMAGLVIDNNSTTVKEYVDYQLSALRKVLEKQISDSLLPVGSIILWEGTEIPDGWAEYTKAAGRVVVGYSAGGIQVNNRYVFTNIGDLYTPSDGTYSITINESNLPRHRHAVGLAKGTCQDNSREGVVPTAYDYRNTSVGGTVGGFASSQGIVGGAVPTSYNQIAGAVNNESGQDSLVIEKLPPSITLRYIIKTE